MNRLAIGLFPGPDEAAQVIQQLRAERIATDELRAIARPGSPANALDNQPEVVARVDGDSFEREVVDDLLKIGLDRREAEQVRSRILDGAVLVLARDQEPAVDRAVNIMNQAGALRLADPDNSSDVPLEDQELDVSSNTVQTGRTRSSGDGARVFVW